MVDGADSAAEAAWPAADSTEADDAADSIKFFAADVSCAIPVNESEAITKPFVKRRLTRVALWNFSKWHLSACIPYS